MNKKLGYAMACTALVAWKANAATTDFDLRVERAVSISFATEAGKSYRLQSSTSPNAVAWSNVGELYVGDGQRRNIGFLTGFDSQAVFRVVEFTLNNGLIAFYPFSGTANDASGNNLTGTVSGAVPVEDRFGQANSAFSFDGVNDFISIPDNAAFETQSFSIGLWFYPQRNPAAADFLISKGQNNLEIHVGSGATGPTGMRFLPRVATANHWDVPAGRFQLNAWNHIVAIYNPTALSVRVYVNGSLVSITGPATTPIGSDNSSSLRFGMRADNTLPFLGRIDSVRIYNRALTDGEAVELFSLHD